MSTTLKALALASLVAALVVPVAGADSVTYVGTTILSSGCTAVAKLPNGMDSQTCHQVAAGSSRANIEIIDAVFGAKSGFYAFDARPAVSFCGEVDAPVPAGAKVLRVGNNFGFLGCAGTPFEAGTTGTVIVAWS